MIMLTLYNYILSCHDNYRRRNKERRLSEDRIRYKFDLIKKLYILFSHVC